MRRRGSALALAVAGVIAAVLVPAGAVRAAPASFTFKGSGWGHRVGMPQYGALEQAKDGRSWKQILAYYYKGSSIGTNDVPARVRVLLAGAVSQVTVEAQSRFNFTSGGQEIVSSPGGDGKWIVRRQPSGQFTIFRPGGLPAAAPVTTAQPLKINYEPWSTVITNQETGLRLRWGKVELAASGDKIRMVLDIALEKYVRGIAEIPSSWPTEALRAQAVAARTYAADKARRLGHHREGCDCTLYADTRDQVYRGYDKEDPAVGSNARWVSAVDETAGQVATHSSHPIQAYFHSSSGGRTESSGEVWSTDLPYLKPVDDQWSMRSSNPYAHWEIKRAQEDVADRLDMTRVDTIEIKSKTAGGGVKEVVVRGNVTKTLGGNTFRSKLGLRSTMFNVAGSQEAIWSPWRRIEPNDRAGGSPSLAAASDGVVHALVTSPGGVPYASRRDPSTGKWSPWARIGSLSNASDPGITISSSGAAQAIARGSGGEIWTARLIPGGSWSSWVRIGSSSSRGREPAISAGPDGIVWAVMRGQTSDDVWASRRDASRGWSGWTRIGADGREPNVVGTSGGAIAVVRGNNDAIRSSSFSGSWSALRQVSNGYGKAPSLSHHNGKVLLAVRGRSSDRIYASTFGGSGWSSWSEVSSALVGTGAAPTALVDRNGRLHVFVRGPSDVIYTATKGSGSWAGYFQVGDSGDRADSGTTIASAAVPGRVYVLIRGPSDGLFTSYRSSS